MARKILRTAALAVAVLAVLTGIGVLSALVAAELLLSALL